MAKFSILIKITFRLILPEKFSSVIKEEKYPGSRTYATVLVSTILHFFFQNENYNDDLHLYLEDGTQDI